jgi:hypothetical protein
MINPSKKVVNPNKNKLYLGNPNRLFGVNQIQGFESISFY